MAGKVLGVLKEGFDTCVPDTQAAVKQFLSTVDQAGLTLKDVSVPLHQHGRLNKSKVIEH